MSDANQPKNSKSHGRHWEPLEHGLPYELYVLCITGLTEEEWYHPYGVAYDCAITWHTAMIKLMSTKRANRMNETPQCP
jgi:hypothetical protein